MSDVRYDADYAQPADLTRLITVARIALGAVALALAVWLAFGSYDKYRAQAEAVFAAQFEARQAAAERDVAVAERNAALGELEELRAGQGKTGLSGAGLARLDSYLAEIEKNAEAAHSVALDGDTVKSAAVLPTLKAIRETAGEARKYILASEGVPGATGGPGRDALPAGDAKPALTPSSWNPEEPPARLIPASLSANAAVAPVPPVEAPGVISDARLKLYVVLGMLGILGVTFLIAVIAVFTTRNARKHAFATDTIKTLLGFFIGVVTAFMGAPG